MSTKRFLSDAVLAQETDDVFYFLCDIRNMLKYAFELQYYPVVGSVLLDVFIKSVGQELQFNK